MNEKKEKVKKERHLLSKLSSYLFVLVLSFLVYFVAFGGIRALKPISFLKEYKTYQISIDADLPTDIAEKLKTDLLSIEYNGIKRFELSESATNKIVWQEGDGVYTQYYVPVSNFYAISNEFNSSKQTALLDETIPAPIRNILKAKYPNSKDTTDFAKSLDKNGKNIAFINANDLTYKYQLLILNKKYFLDDLSGGLKFSLNVENEDAFLKRIIDRSLVALDNQDFDLSKVGKINQTGVTAITRVLAQKTSASGDGGYPATKISAFLKDADITHVSNEISFVTGCAPVLGMRFCSNPAYMKTLTDSGVDVVELTGNHNNDYGSDWNLYTLKLYDKKGIKYFGGGKNTADSEKILYLDIKGTQVAFLGYNYYDTMLGTGAIASTTHAGSNSYSVSKLKKNIAEAKKNANLVIVDFQFQECYSYPSSDVIFPLCYKPLSSPDQTATFRKAIDLGADIVVGTQAHQPQTYEIYKNKLIFYGLGNLFFDQTNWIGTRHGMIITHYIMDGKLLQTKITTTNYDADLKTYITKGSQRELLLNLLKDAREK